MEHYPLAHVARIFSSYEEDTEKECGVSPEVMTVHKMSFPWLATDNLDNIHCNVCTNAYVRRPSSVVMDEWTCPSVHGYVSYNSQNLILILKIHNFSENHLKAEEVLKNIVFSNDIDKDTNKIIVSNNNTIPMRCDTLKPGYLKWGRFLSKFPWMYIKEHNPGCLICEKAVELSKKLPFTKWSDSNLQEPMRTDKPTKMLTQHHLSKYHKTAEAIVIANNNKDRNNIEHIEQAISISTDDEKANEVKPPVSDVEWSRLLEKYNWLCGENGLYYGCKVCQSAKKVSPTMVSQNIWTENMIPFTEKVWYTYLVKKCYNHNTTLGHGTAEAIVHNLSDACAQYTFNNEELPSYSTSNSNNASLRNKELSDNIIDKDTL